MYNAHTNTHRVPATTINSNSNNKIHGQCKRTMGPVRACGRPIACTAAGPWVYGRGCRFQRARAREIRTRRRCSTPMMWSYIICTRVWCVCTPNVWWARNADDDVRAVCGLVFLRWKNKSNYSSSRIEKMIVFTNIHMVDCFLNIDNTISYSDIVQVRKYSTSNSWIFFPIFSLLCNTVLFFRRCYEYN